MIKHIVMWQVKDNPEYGTKQDIMHKIKYELEGLKDVIDSIVEIEVGINVEPSQMAYDVVLYSVFRDEEGLAAYQKHPAHQKVGKELMSQVTKSRVVVDYLV